MKLEKSMLRGKSCKNRNWKFISDSSKALLCLSGWLFLKSETQKKDFICLLFSLCLIWMSSRFSNVQSNGNLLNVLKTTCSLLLFLYASICIYIHGENDSNTAWKWSCEASSLLWLTMQKERKKKRNKKSVNLFFYPRRFKLNETISTSLCFAFSKWLVKLSLVEISRQAENANICYN